MSSSAGESARPGAAAQKVSATLALALLVFINLFNYIDRQVLAAVEPQIRKELFPTDDSGMEPVHAKAATGWFATAFLLSYMAIAPVFGLLADRVSRWWLVGFGVILWSLASGGSGVNWGVSLASAYWILLLTRCFVGVGEAAYGPVAPAMIADLYPVAKRGQVMSWFYMAIPVGGALGYALGGGIVNLYGDAQWRWAFYSVVPLGVALGVWCFFMPDPPRGQTEQAVTAALPRKLTLKDYLYILTIPSFTFNTLGMTMMTFAIGGLAFWMPAYLEERGVLDVGPIDSKTMFGGITAVAGLVSTLAGGLAGDWLRPRFSGSYFLVSGFALLLGFPMTLLMIWTPFPWAWVFIFLAVFFLFFNTGPTNTILANVIHPSMRGSAFALNILIIHAFGDAISPPLIGWISGGQAHLDRGFIVVSLAMLVGGIIWLMGAKYLKHDAEMAPSRLPS
jgi:MFS family permease